MMRLDKVAAKFKSGNKTLTSKKTKGKFEKVMHEFKNRSLHSGKLGKVVTNPKQAKAIAFSEMRRMKR